MHAIVGPILAREGGYAFDSWTPEEGLSRGFAYRRVGDAHYARNVEIRSPRKGRPDPAVACSTIEEFTLAVAERETTFRALVSNLAIAPVGSTDRQEPRRYALVSVIDDHSLSGTPASSSSSHTVAVASEGARQSP